MRRLGRQCFLRKAFTLAALMAACGLIAVPRKTEPFIVVSLTRRVANCATSHGSDTVPLLELFLGDAP